MVCRNPVTILDYKVVEAAALNKIGIKINEGWFKFYYEKLAQKFCLTLSHREKKICL